MRVIECAELLAPDLFKNAEQTRQWLTFGDAPSSGPAGQPSPRLWVWPMWAAGAGHGAACVCNRQRLAATSESDQGTGHALGRIDTNLQRSRYDYTCAAGPLMVTSQVTAVTAPGVTASSD